MPLQQPMCTNMFPENSKRFDMNPQTLFSAHKRKQLKLSSQHPVLALSRTLQWSIQFNEPSIAGQAVSANDCCDSHMPQTNGNFKHVSLKKFLAALALLLCSSASCHAPVFPALLWRVATDPLLTVFRGNRFETWCAFDHIKPMVDAFFPETVSDFPAT